VSGGVIVHYYHKGVGWTATDPKPPPLAPPEAHRCSFSNQSRLLLHASLDMHETKQGNEAVLLCVWGEWFHCWLEPEKGGDTWEIQEKTTKRPECV